MKLITYTVTCACGWTAGPFTSCTQASKAAKEHDRDTVHRDCDDVPLFGGAQ